MFKPWPILDEASVCLRCHHRLLRRRQCLSTHLQPSYAIGHTRGLTRGQRKAQELVQYDDGRPKDDPVVSSSRPKISSRGYKPNLSFAHRSIKLHRKDPLGVDSLGRPAEILVVTTPAKERESILHARRIDQRGREEALGSAEEMVDKISAEQGIASERGVTHNLEQLRNEWLSNRKWQGRPLSTAEQDDLVARLDAGFTVKQLMGYHTQNGLNSAVHPSNLDKPYSGTLYTRSHWTAGVTAYPGDALARRRICRAEAIAIGHVEARLGSDIGEATAPMMKTNTPKTAIIERILRECWQLRAIKDEEALGELDVYLQPVHNLLLLNHDQGIFRRLSEKYGVKIDTSKSQNVVRITGDRGVCSDVFEFLVYILQRIEKEEMELHFPQGTTTGKSIRNDPTGDLKFYEEVQRLTNAIIKPILPVPGGQSSKKVNIYYLGPSKDDLADAQRILSHSGQATEVYSSPVHWGAAPGDFSAVPSPVDISNGLPLADRMQQWSRWVLPRRRKAIPAGWTMAPSGKPHQIDLGLAQRAFESQVIKQSLRADFLPPEHPGWPAAASQSSSLSLGYFLYPSKTVKGLKVEAPRRRLSRGFIQSLNSPRRFLTNNLGLKPPPFVLTGSKVRYTEGLLIRMTPRLVATRPKDDLAPIPDLEISVLVDKQERSSSFNSLRLIFKTRKSDLLLPDLPVDLRFATELYATGALSLEKLPQLRDFLNSSNLNIWGTERLKTPPILSLPIPRYSVANLSKGDSEDTYVTDETAATAAPKNIEYAFASLEHRSELVERRGEHEIVYFVTEAGRTGGRRDGVRIISQAASPVDQGSALAEVANALITNPRTMGYYDASWALIPDHTPRHIDLAELS